MIVTGSQELMSSFLSTCVQALNTRKQYYLNLYTKIFRYRATASRWKAAICILKRSALNKWRRHMQSYMSMMGIWREIFPSGDSQNLTTCLSVTWFQKDKKDSVSGGMIDTSFSFEEAGMVYKTSFRCCTNKQDKKFISHVSHLHAFIAGSVDILFQDSYDAEIIWMGSEVYAPQQKPQVLIKKLIKIRKFTVWGAESDEGLLSV